MSYDAQERSSYGSQPYELYLFQTADQEWALTSCDREMPFAGRNFYPLAGLHRSDVNKANENKSDDVVITVPIDHALAQLYTAYMPSSQLTLVVFRGHVGDLETVVNFAGVVKSAKFTDDGCSCELTCSPDEAQLKRRIPRACFQKKCGNIVFQPGCELNRAAWAVPSTITYVNGEVIKAMEFGAKDDGWFTGGYIEVGNLRRMILDHTGETCTLMLSIESLHLGDQVTAYPGCDGTYDVCVQKFTNGANYAGFDRIPQRNPFKGLNY